jgi:hypothetical protein
MTVQHPPNLERPHFLDKKNRDATNNLILEKSLGTIYPCVFEKFLVVSQVFGTTIEIILSRTSTSFISF